MKRRVGEGGGGWGWTEKKAAKQKNVRTGAISPQPCNAAETLGWIYNSFAGRERKGEVVKGGLGVEEEVPLIGMGGGRIQTWRPPASQNRQKKTKKTPIYQLAESKTSFAELDFVSTSVVPNCGAVRNQRRTRQQKLGLKPTTLSDGVTELIFLLGQFCLNV